MRRQYEYLQDSYYEDLNSQKVRRNFLKQLDGFVNQKQYIRITLLNWNEEPLKEIEGTLTGGSMNKDGSSSFRRTCSFSAEVSGETYDIDSLNSDFAINKKIFLEIGIKNYTNQYPQYPILYFPQGVFFISDFNMNSSATSSVQLSLSLKDKMAGLSGEVGGTFTATVQLDTMDTQTPSGEYISEKVLVYEIIKELVHHWGGENLNNIVIEDVPLRIKQVMQWHGNTPLYLIPQEGTSAQARDLWYEATVEPPKRGEDGELEQRGIIQVPIGNDAGFEYMDFIYTGGELTVSPGDNVCNVLDTLKDYLGNFEYFYDEFGVFHFREIKNYLNTTQATEYIEDMNEHSYLADIADGKYAYSFEDDSNIISITVTPQYQNIKNDYMILGLRESTNSDITFPVIYHLAIDKKPEVGNVYHNLLIYKEDITKLTKAAFPLSVKDDAALPLPGNFNIIYRLSDTNEFFYWSEDAVYKPIEAIKYYPSETEGAGYLVKDWRTELYLQGMLNKNIGTDAGTLYNNLKIDYDKSITDTSWIGRLYRKTNAQRIDTDYYFEELDAFWPQIYDLEKQEFYGMTPTTTIRQSLLDQIENYRKKIDEVKEDASKNNLDYTEAIKKNNAENKKLEAENKVLQEQYDIYHEITYATLEALNASVLEWEQKVVKFETDSKKPENKNNAKFKQQWESAKARLASQTKKRDTSVADRAETLAKIQDKIKENKHTIQVNIEDNAYKLGQNKKENEDYEKEQVDYQKKIEELQKQIDALEDKTLLTSSLCDGVYYLDFIDSSSSNLGEYSVANIGRRTDVVQNNNINCLFEPEIPDIVFLNKDMEDKEELANLRSECSTKGQPYTQVSQEIYNAFRTGGYKNSAFIQLQYELYLHTNYQRSISISAIPAWYLEPNTRIYINNRSTQTYGDYMMNSISYSFGAANPMSVSANECVQKM